MEISLTVHAYRQLKKLPPDIQAQIRTAIDGLAEWPCVRGVKGLQNRDDYRLRVGRSRVFFEVTTATIWVTQIIIRNEHTY